MFALSVFGRPGVAAEGAALAAQRSAFLQAEQALRQGDQPRFQRLRAGLDRYPLAPYLDHAEIRRDLAAADPALVRDFLDRHADVPLADALARDWLRLASDRGDAGEVIRSYRPTTDADLRCRYLAALRATGAESALGEVRGLWLSGRPLPGACAPLVDAWRAAGLLTADLVRERIDLAMEAGQTELARELAADLDPRDRALVAAWVALRADPAGLAGAEALAGDRPEVRRVVVDLVTRWARRDAGGAAAAWETVGARYTFSGADRAAVHKAIGRGLARQDDARALEWLAAIPDAEADAQVREAAVLSALRLGRWASARDGLRRMPAAEGGSDRWRYWTARALAEAGETGEATARFADLA
ncbi:MAG: lytic murein transglycosylase, partial [Gammaproteobacteria bacterium]|nr:lytic murein transglycosylase [Gammaproteobacteria bacterium]